MVFSLRNRILSVITLILAIGNFCSAQVSTATIDSLVNEAMTQFKVAGLAVGVVQDGKIIHSKGYGYANVEKKNEVTEHTNFAIASNSKAFTATAIGILVEEGKLEWDAKVKSIIPEFEMYNEYVTNNFTVKDLLSHRSGMGLGQGDLMWFPDGNDFKIDDMLTAFSDVEPRSGIRTELRYNNILFFIAGEVIARVSGMSWEDFIAKRIFEPVGMESSVTSISRIGKLPLASPHANFGGQLKVLDDYAPQVNGAAAGIYANVNDLCNWMMLQLNHGTLGDVKVFDAKTQKNHLWKLHTVTSANGNPKYNAHFGGYGLGWFLGDMNGNLVASHSGGMPGMLSKTTLITDKNVGIVILTNTSDDGAMVFSALTNTLGDAFLEVEPTNWIGRYATYYKQNTANTDSVVQAVWSKVTASNVSTYDKQIVGKYSDSWFGDIEIKKKGGKLILCCERSPKLTGELFYYSDFTYLVKWDYQDMNADAYVKFDMTADSAPTGFSLEGVSPNIDFSFDFDDLKIKRVK
ncbi:MAG: serine hydrolase [Bacteroidetes bacterium]|nr:MAG: serine hydrolase [Bacteroidota bacterium]